MEAAENLSSYHGDMTSVDIRGRYGGGATVCLRRDSSSRSMIMVLPGVDGTAVVPKGIQYYVCKFTHVDVNAPPLAPLLERREAAREAAKDATTRTAPPPASE